MFLDQAAITVRGGDGGDGCVAWRREKFVPKGGPAGGNGGRGGDVWITADPNTDTLSAYVSRKRFVAGNGAPGSGSERAGADGEDLRLPVPPGTAVWLEDDGKRTLLRDLVHPGDRLLVARGGRGGYGNAHFKSSTRQRPDFAELGEPGEERSLFLELRLVADVGIIGLPNAGKSTLIAAISAARPKIAAYPFTTLVPHLGVVHVGGRSFVVCDIPGLIEGASEGKGLGHTFLRHVERCGVLVHLLDLSRGVGADGRLHPAVLVQDYRTIRRELERHSQALLEKRELVVISKTDLHPQHATEARRALEAAGIRVAAQVSAAAHRGTRALVRLLLPIILEERTRRAQAPATGNTGALPVLRPVGHSRMGDFRVHVTAEAIRVEGKRIEQLAVMTNFASAGGVERLLNVLDRVGLRRELLRMRSEHALPVFIGTVRIDPYLTGGERSSGEEGVQGAPHH